MAKDVAMSPQFSSSISGSGYALPEIAVKTKTSKQRKPADAHFCRLALLCVENKNTATAEQLRYKNPRPRCCVVVDTSGISAATGCNAPCFEGMLVSLGYSFELVSEQDYNNSPFAGKIICGDCGEIFGSKVWHSTSKYRRTIWRCNAKYENGDTCTTPHLYEDDLKQYFITALSQLLTDRTALLEDGRFILSELLDTAALDADSESTLQEMDVVAGMIQQAVNENANQAADQTAYADRYNSLVERYEKLQASYDALQAQLQRRQAQAESVGNCLKALEELDLLQIAFTDGLWNTVVDHVTVYADDRLVFHFKNGAEQEVKICK